MSYLTDADVVIDALAGRQHATQAIGRCAQDGIAISIVTKGEVFEGAHDEPNPQAKLETYRRFLAPFAVIGVDEPIIERFAEVRALLRRRGETIPDLDILMGVTAVHHGLTLLTNNVRHLRRVPSIQILQTKAPGGESG